MTPSVARLLGAYLGAVALSEPLLSEVWASSGLTVVQLRALRRLARGPASLGQLALDLGLAPPSVTRIVDRLEGRGLIERRRDDGDRRKVVAAIVPEGERLVGSLPTLAGTAIGRAVEQFDPEEREQLASAFLRFTELVRTFERELPGLETEGD